MLNIYLLQYVPSLRRFKICQDFPKFNYWHLYNLFFLSRCCCSTISNFILSKCYPKYLGKYFIHSDNRYSSNSSRRNSNNSVGHISDIEIQIHLKQIHIFNNYIIYINKYNNILFNNIINI